MRKLENSLACAVAVFALGCASSSADQKGVDGSVGGAIDAGDDSDAASGTDAASGADAASAADAAPGTTLTVTAPNGGETFAAGDTVTVTWSSSAGVSAVDIELHRAGSLDLTLATGEANDGSFDWVVPTDVVDASDYTVVVRDAAAPTSFDEGDAAFAILNWQYRVEITIASSTARTDYPVMVELTSANFAYASARADGADLRLATTPDRANGFDLPYYVENYSSGGTSRIWVRVPSLAIGNTSIYLFYGQAGASSLSDESSTIVDTWTSAGGETLTGTISVDRFTVQAGHTVRLSTAAPVVVSARIIEIAGTVDGIGLGYAGGGTGGGSGPGAGGGSSNSGAGGGGYGGLGGLGGYDSGDTPGTRGPVNGTASSSAIAMGSGGGGPSDVNGGAGGGALTLTGYRIDVSGTINVRGADGVWGSTTGRGSGGGAGGGILMIGAELALSGTLIATGGAGGTDTSTSSDGGGGGGGGRIKRFYELSIADTATYDVAGGAGGDFGDTASGEDGGSGTTHSGTGASGEPMSTLGSAENVF